MDEIYILREKERRRRVIPWTETSPFVIPPELLESKTLYSGTLLRLPTEVLIQILSYVTDIIDKVAVALASKRLLQLCALRGLNVPSVAKYRHSPWNVSQPAIELLHRLAPVDKLGRRKRGLAICEHCCKYRVTKKSHWRIHGDDYRRLDPSKEACEQWARVLSEWAARESSLCPDCWAYSKMFNITQYGWYGTEEDYDRWVDEIFPAGFWPKYPARLHPPLN